MTTALKRLLILLIGWGFILLGIVGLFLPILQGILFILVGLIILSSEYVWAHHLLGKLKRRFPGVARRSHDASSKAKVWLVRLRLRRSAGSTDGRPLA